MNFSVVIATLGHDCLLETIQSINSGSIVPDEIIISIPEKEYSEISLSFPDNVKILSCPERGQVAQRVYGFKKSQGEYILQLDDDIILDKDCIKILFAGMEEFQSIAIAPIMLDLITKESVYKINNKSWQHRIYTFLTNGLNEPMPGTIDRAGTAIGFRQDQRFPEFTTVEWLAGGCVLHSRDNLLMDNYFPFKGKAYGEDVIHSLILRERGIELLIAQNACCYLQTHKTVEMNLKQYLDSLHGDYKIRTYIKEKTRYVTWRLFFFYLTSFCAYSAKRMIKSLDQ